MYQGLMVLLRWDGPDWHEVGGVDAPGGTQTPSRWQGSLWRQVVEGKLQFQLKHQLCDAGLEH